MRLFLVIICICCVQKSYSQDTTNTWKCALSCKPLGLINPVLPNLTAGVICKLNNKVCIELQAGYIYKVPLLNYSPENKIKLQGYRVNLEFKLFFYDHFYGGAQLLYNSYRRATNEYFFRYARTYQELIALEKHVDTYIGHLKLGEIVPLVKDKILLDCYFGFGLRYKMIALVSQLPDDATAVERRGVDFSTDNFGDQLYPSATAGFSLLYIIR